MLNKTDADNGSLARAVRQYGIDNGIYDDSNVEQDESNCTTIQEDDGISLHWTGANEPTEAQLIASLAVHDATVGIEVVRKLDVATLESLIGTVDVYKTEQWLAKADLARAYLLDNTVNVDALQREVDARTDMTTVAELITLIFLREAQYKAILVTVESVFQSVAQQVVQGLIAYEDIETVYNTELAAAM